MKINEFDNNPVDAKIPFDVAEDCSVFMRNDPMFYRRKYYPALMQLKDEYKKSKKIDPEKIFGSVVDSGIQTYNKKFKLAKRPSDVFGMDDRKNIINKIYTEELKNIKDGKY